MKILVTGGAGFIGSHLAERLLAAGERVIALDDLSTGKRSNLPRHAVLEFVEGDIRDAELVERAARGREERRHEPARPGDILHSRADVARLKRAFGGAPATSFEHGLKKLLESPAD